jgi:hypothetical protein
VFDEVFQSRQVRINGRLWHGLKLARYRVRAVNALRKPSEAMRRAREPGRVLVGADQQRRLQ